MKSSAHLFRGFCVRPNLFRESRSLRRNDVNSHERVTIMLKSPPLLCHIVKWSQKCASDGSYQGHGRTKVAKYKIEVYFCSHDHKWDGWFMREASLEKLSTSLAPLRWWDCWENEKIRSDTEHWAGEESWLLVWELIISCHCESDKNINSRMDDTLIHCGHRVRFVFFEAQWDIIVGRLETWEEREPPRRDRYSGDIER